MEAEATVSVIEVQMVVRKVGVLFIMLVKSLHVRWFRSIVDETLECTQLPALLGPNGCGKSSFLRALDLFYVPHPRPTADDYYAGDISRNMEIEVVFTALNLLRSAWGTKLNRAVARSGIKTAA
jgi:predicted ATP-dependent endonuclease of OLD family